MEHKRITDNVTVNTVTNCWDWVKSCSSSGYGQFTEGGKYWSAHVYSWALHNGPLPHKSIVRHSCHNKKCCNPRHLELGSHKDNWKDSEKTHREASTKRRHTWSLYGERYQTCREAVAATGISIGSIIKYTKQGLFDDLSYEAGCIKGKRKH